MRKQQLALIKGRAILRASSETEESKIEEKQWALIRITRKCRQLKERHEKDLKWQDGWKRWRQHGDEDGCQKYIGLAA